jgi:hypothetical protein
MPRFYDLARLQVPQRHHAEASRILAATRGLLGCWAAEIGALNEIFLLRGFASGAEWLETRLAEMAAPDPFGLGGLLTGVSLEAHQGFDFLPPPAPGAHGPVYEIRCYDLRPGTLPVVQAAWARKLPARAALSPVLVAMSALDGRPRFTHIWPYPSLEARARIRAEAAAQGLWPPNAFPGSLPPPMQSTICLPLPCSPMQ